MKWLRLIGLVLVLGLNFTWGIAQTQDGIVPDLTGLNIPQATAALNKVGLKLGTQTYSTWTSEVGIAQNTISTQAVEAGKALELGGVVDVTVLVLPNIRLLYDDNDLTIINLTEEPLALDTVTIQGLDGNQASFDMASWGGELRAKQCFQIWSVNRNGPKGLDECATIQNWMTTTDARDHYWISANGITSFDVLEDGITRAICTTAPPNSQDVPTSCEFFISTGLGDVIEYMYLVYTPQRLIVMNPSSDKWLRTNRTKIINPNPNNTQLGASFILGDANIFGNPEIVANIRRLAPGQCLLFKLAGADAEPLPQTCDVIAQVDVSEGQVFWLSDFKLESRTGANYVCTAAVSDKRTICIMPR